MTPIRKERLIKRLAGEGLKTLGFFRALEPDDWARQVYTSGTGWTVKAVCCHLLNAEQGFHLLISDILHGGSGSPEDMNINDFNERQIREMAPMETAALLEAFARARMKTIDLVHSMQPGDLDREGRHPFFGIVPLEKMLKLIYRHNMIHQRDIRRALDKGNPVDALSG